MACTPLSRTPHFNPRQRVGHLCTYSSNRRPLPTLAPCTYSPPSTLPPWLPPDSALRQKNSYVPLDTNDSVVEAVKVAGPSLNDVRSPNGVPSYLYPRSGPHGLESNLLPPASQTTPRGAEGDPNKSIAIARSDTQGRTIIGWL